MRGSSSTAPRRASGGTSRPSSICAGCGPRSSRRATTRCSSSRRRRGVAASRSCRARSRATRSRRAGSSSSRRSGRAVRCSRGSTRTAADGRSGAAGRRGPDRARPAEPAFVASGKYVRPRDIAGYGQGESPQGAAQRASLRSLRPRRDQWLGRCPACHEWKLDGRGGRQRGARPVERERATDGHGADLDRRGPRDQRQRSCAHAASASIAASSCHHVVLGGGLVRRSLVLLAEAIRGSESRRC